MSHLYRFLVFGVLIDMWGIIGQSISKREISYHFPIQIMINKEDYMLKEKFKLLKGRLRKCN